MAEVATLCSSLNKNLGQHTYSLHNYLPGMMTTCLVVSGICVLGLTWKLRDVSVLPEALVAVIVYLRRHKAKGKTTPMALQHSWVPLVTHLCNEVFTRPFQLKSCRWPSHQAHVVSSHLNFAKSFPTMIVGHSQAHGIFYQTNETRAKPSKPSIYDFFEKRC